MLPTEYADGMPLGEFKELEKNIANYIEKIERIEIAKLPDDYLDIEWGWDMQSKVEAIKNQNDQDNVPYIFQIVFGDTEWTSEANQTRSTQATNQPVRPPGSWTHSAEIWVTLNLYNVSTGRLEASSTITASSTEDRNYSGVSQSLRVNHKRAINAAQKVIWNKIKLRIKTLFPLDISIQKIENIEAKADATVTLNVGAFHGMSQHERFFVYYEKEYEVRGRKVIRHVAVSRLKGKKLGDKTMVCRIDYAHERIAQLLEEGKVLKCKIIDYNESSKVYGF